MSSVNHDMRNRFLADLACQIKTKAITICCLCVCLYHFVQDTVFNAHTSYVARNADTSCICVHQIFGIYGKYAIYKNLLGIFVSDTNLAITCKV